MVGRRSFVRHCYSRSSQPTFDNVVKTMSQTKNVNTLCNALITRVNGAITLIRMFTCIQNRIVNKINDILVGNVGLFKFGDY